MTLEAILTAYQNSPALQQLEKAMDVERRALLKGLVGSQDAIIAAAFYKSHPDTHIFILSDKEEAAYFQNNLQNILDKKDVLFFPDTFKRLAQIDEVNPTNIGLRTECINRISNSETTGELICTYPAALFEKVVSKKSLVEHTIKIKVNENLNVDHLTEQLVNHGFEHVDFVYESGQFSIRGGIIDVFSYANEFPYRIELFDVEVESIRTFDPSNQLSQKKISSISIVPNIQKQYTEEALVSIFSTLPESSTIWIKDTNMMIEVIEKCWEKANKILSKTPIIETEDIAFKAESFCSIKEVLFDITPFKIIEFGGQGFFVKELKQVALNT